VRNNNFLKIILTTATAIIFFKLDYVFFSQIVDDLIYRLSSNLAVIYGQYPFLYPWLSVGICLSMTVFMVVLLFKVAEK
jgi:thiol-disulfide isomerase/thioredoxin